MNKDEELGNAEAYLDGTMPVDERIRFEKRMEEDMELKNLVTLTRTATEAIVLAGYKAAIAEAHQRYRAGLQGSAATTPSSPPVRKISYAIVSGIAATLLLLLVAGITVYFDAKSNLIERKYDVYTIPVDRSADLAEDEWIRLFRNEDWGSLLTYQDRAVTPRDLFFVGYALYKSERYSEASTFFKRAKETSEQKDNQPFAEESSYFLALSLLRDGEYRPALEEIAAMKEMTNHAYTERFSNWDVLKIKMLQFF